MAESLINEPIGNDKYLKHIVVKTCPNSNESIVPIIHPTASQITPQSLSNL